MFFQRPEVPTAVQSLAIEVQRLETAVQWFICFIPFQVGSFALVVFVKSSLNRQHRLRALESVTFTQAACVTILRLKRTCLITAFKNARYIFDEHANCCQNSLFLRRSQNGVKHFLKH